MLRRWLWTFVLLTIAHGIVSGIALLFIIAAAMSPGWGWLAGVLCYLFFLPWLLLAWVQENGVDLFPLDTPLAFAINSLIWSAIVSTLWLVGSHLRDKKRHHDPEAYPVK